MRRENRSGQGLITERCPVGSKFSESLFLDVPGTATEHVRTGGFRRNSSSLDKAPKKRDSVRLNSLERFLITLPSISSETWEMYFWAISGSSMFCDWLFFVFPEVSPETAANFLLIFKVTKILREKFCQLWRLNWISTFYSKSNNLILLWGKSFNENKQLMISTNEYNTRSLQIY